jgi:NAD(P)-dependent dehydrogenase (short-subunit alcohol dehydrogenase family)
MTSNEHALDAILVVMDGTARARSIMHQILRSGRNVAVAGTSSRDLVPYVDAAVRHRVWAVVADPSDPAQIDAIIERATDIVGPVIMIVDPGGLLSDVHSADRRVA